MLYKNFNSCQISGSKNLELILSLGLIPLVNQMSKINSKVQEQIFFPTEIYYSPVSKLVQLGVSVDKSLVFPKEYPYTSSTTKILRDNFQELSEEVFEKFNVESDDLVIDIGSNDGTTLSAFSSNLQLVGVDPTGEKFKEYYPEHIELISDFFSDKLIRASYPNKNAKVITSFSMFYDLESPQEFVDQISNILDPKKGVWVFEQSYMPLMLERKSYDTICHEHLEYYSLYQIIWLLDRAELKIIDLEVNDINGGSFSVMAAHKSSSYLRNDNKINEFLLLEKRAELDTIKPFLNFQLQAQESKKELKEFISKTKNHGQSISALGASTKGNVILQYCDIDSSQIEEIGEVNSNKFGTVTPGSMIPINSEEIVLSNEPDYLIILPWHFRDFFVKNSKFIGRNLVFPLSELEIVTPKN